MSKNRNNKNRGGNGFMSNDANSVNKTNVTQENSIEEIKAPVDPENNLEEQVVETEVADLANNGPDDEGIIVETEDGEQIPMSVDDLIKAGVLVPSTSNVVEDKASNEKVEAVEDKASDEDVEKASIEESKIEEVKKEVNPPKTSSSDSSVDEVKVGMPVALKESCKTTVTGAVIPAFAYKNAYKVAKILPNRILIQAGSYSIPVKREDITIQ